MSEETFEALVSEVREGRCVAFVGAGFSVPTVPPWRELLLQVAGELDGASGREIAEKRLAGAGTESARLEALAQHLADRDEEAFVRALRLLASGKTPRDVTVKRRRLLSEIPFAAVLTTNFDAVLPGRSVSSAGFRTELRAERGAWTAEAFWHGGDVDALKLHGSLDDARPIITRRDYRKRLYSDPAYLTFLRAVFATRTVLYLGFSFTDAYLNELRSEVLAMFGHQKHDRPIAFAIVPDVDEDIARYYREVEGIGLLRYDSGSDGRDHHGFDDQLEKLHARTNPKARLGEILAGKQILWMDPSPRNNDYGRRFIREAASGRCALLEVTSVDDALAHLASGAADFDLVLTHWGHQPEGPANAERLLREMRARGWHAPVIVFASPDFAETNRPRALRLGAFAFEHQWSGLFREMQRLFERRTSA